MKTLFRSALACAIMTFVGMIALSAMTVTPDGAEFHKKCLSAAYAIFAAWVLIIFAMWITNRRAGKVINAPKWAEVTSMVVAATYSLFVLLTCVG